MLTCATHGARDQQCTECKVHGVATPQSQSHRALCVRPWCLRIDSAGVIVDATSPRRPPRLAQAAVRTWPVTQNATRSSCVMLMAHCHMLRRSAGRKSRALDRNNADEVEDVNEAKHA